MPFDALTQQERARAQAIGSVSRREQFLAGRWLAKTMLAEVQGGAPEDWKIDAHAHAKPRVIGHDLQLSISHSGPLVACCIANRAVGIDIEGFDRARPVAEMASLVCSEHEQSSLRPLHVDALTQRFFQLWTAKEARLKQLGASFDIGALRAIQMAPSERSKAHAGTWCFLGQQKVMLSLAVEDMSCVSVRWPADWVAGPMQWHTYI